MPTPTAVKTEPEKPVKKLADINPLITVKCPSCGADSHSMFPIRVRTAGKVHDFEICGICLSQTARQPVTFKLRFNCKSGDPIREVLKNEAVKI
ncbi:hypothetical protein [Glutamicibacter sp.]|jgi:hypothetical protein|uniref:hypothetical protein n=1 Tax=Glutamicibacter sp. TaxID=1931995 RepID=UPI002FD8D87E